MSHSGNDGKRYEVGYRKPPKSYRFKKGVSGNPSGKKKRRPGNHDEPDRHTVEQLFAAEAGRTIHVTENGRPLELTMLEAAIRSISIKAVKGDTRSVRILLEHVSAANWRKAAEEEELFSAVVDYVDEWHRTGFNPSDTDPTAPDPRDIGIDFARRDYICRTPLTDDHRESAECVAVIRDSCLLDFEEWLSDPEPRSVALEAYLQDERKKIERLNRLLPARLRPDLNPHYRAPNLTFEAAVTGLGSQSVSKAERKKLRQWWDSFSECPLPRSKIGIDRAE